MKTIYIILTALSILYIGDAVYPSWDWKCSGHQTKIGLWSNPSQPNAFSDGSQRALNPDRPEGCIVLANNVARRVFDWMVVK